VSISRVAKIQEELMEVTLEIINMAIETSTTLKRWRQVNNIIIPKRKKSNFLKDFKNIHIYKAYWNAVMSIKW
jgi:hypothetical protein